MTAAIAIAVKKANSLQRGDIDSIDENSEMTEEEKFGTVSRVTSSRNNINTGDDDVDDIGVRTKSEDNNSPKSKSSLVNDVSTSAYKKKKKYMKAIKFDPAVQDIPVRVSLSRLANRFNGRFLDPVKEGGS